MTFYHRLSLAAVSVCLVLVGTLLLPSRAPAQAPSLDILVSIEAQAFFVRRLAGELARVTVLVPPGASPHSFEPKPSQMKAVANADLYLTLGVAFEDAWLERFKSANPSLVIEAVDKGITRRPMAARGHHDHGHGHGHQALDPHIWLSPTLAAVMAENAHEALVRADPEDASVFDANLEGLLKEIKGLQQEIQGFFKGQGSRRFLVFHPSWGYFAHEFNLTQMPIEIAGQEPSMRELSDLVREAREHGVRAVFVQPQMSRRTAEVVAREIGGQVVVADPLAGNWAENLRQVASDMSKAMKEQH